jgi:two-component system, chemotaxis family, response regulator WspF
VKIGIISERSAAVEKLRRAIALKRAHRVVWSADNAIAAAHLAAVNRPDLILMALPFDTIDGVEVTRRIMAEHPCAILIVTESVRSNAAFVFDAMGHGALDAVEMPSSSANVSLEGAVPLLAKLDTVARLLGGRQTSPEATARRNQPPSRIRRDLLIAIGASAGGPGAIAAVLQRLPKDLRACIVVVQHVDQEFIPGMASWLSEQSGRRVTIAAEGERPTTGCILLAGGSAHLTMTANGTLGYTDDPQHHAYRPSVDVFFESVSRAWGGDAVGVLLTGMGKDGALGLKALRDKGHFTIAQDEASSAVYGMPKAAAALDAAVEVLPLGRIATRLVEFAARPV